MSNFLATAPTWKLWGQFWSSICTVSKNVANWFHHLETFMPFFCFVFKCKNFFSKFSFRKLLIRKTLQVFQYFLLHFSALLRYSLWTGSEIWYYYYLCSVEVENWYPETVIHVCLWLPISAAPSERKNNFPTKYSMIIFENVENCLCFPTSL